MTLRLVTLCIVVSAGCGKSEDKAPAPAKSDAAKAVPTAKPADAAPAKQPAADAAVAKAAADAATSKTPPEPAVDKNAVTNLKVLPKSWDKKKVSKYMKQMNRGLGVKCKHCHEGTDYASDKLEAKLASRKMLRMTRDMNRKHFKGKQTLTCFTCHQGKEKVKAQ